MNDGKSTRTLFWRRLTLGVLALLVVSNTVWAVITYQILFQPHHRLSRDLDLAAAWPTEPESAPINGIARAGAQFQIQTTKANIFYVSFNTLVTAESLEAAGSLPDWWAKRSVDRGSD